MCGPQFVCLSIRIEYNISDNILTSISVMSQKRGYIKISLFDESLVVCDKCHQFVHSLCVKSLFYRQSEGLESTTYMRHSVANVLGNFWHAQHSNFIRILLKSFCVGWCSWGQIFIAFCFLNSDLQSEVQFDPYCHLRFSSDSS